MSDGGAVKPLVSVCIPVRNRTYDLKHIMPYLLDSAGYEPPIEIVIVNYNSQDDLAQYIQAVFKMPVADGVSISYHKYTGRGYYHMAHARNLSAKIAKGELIQISSADIWYSKDYFKIARNKIAEGYDFVHDNRYKGAIMIWKNLFVDSGGYDERFEFYSPEDRDLENRLIRRGCKVGIIPNGLISIIPTPNDVKEKGYRIPISKSSMGKMMHKILEENDEKNVLVANEGVEWGVW